MKKRKGTSLIMPGVPPSPDWDPASKEDWHMEFEKEEVNDERWTCIVTAAIPSEGQAEECIQDFSLCAESGLRRAIKTINMKDVVNILKEGNVKKEKDKDDKKKNKDPEKVESVPGSPLRPQLLNLAARHVKFPSISNCTLPPDLMAAVLKQLILNMKKENILQKKKRIAREKKARKEKIKANFIRSKMPFKVTEEKASEEKVPPNPMGLKSYVDDEPFGGPDLYIMLTEFYNPFYFSELVRVNVPFVALIKVTGYGKLRKRSRTPTYEKSMPRENDYNYQIGSITEFWHTLKQSCLDLEETVKFQHIAMMQYEAPFLKNLQQKEQVYSSVFEQLSWTQYSAYYIYRQHQNYLKDMHVQQMVLSLETLDLSKCEVYNKLCDALITGEPNTHCLVLYAIIEQVVVGVPETESLRLEYRPSGYDLFSADSEADSLAENDSSMKSLWETIPEVPCKNCRGKRYQIGKHCPKAEVSQLEKGEWFDKKFEGKTATTTTVNEILSDSKEKSPQSVHCEEQPISEELIIQVLTDKKSEKEIRSNKKWISPRLYLYGDAVSLQIHHCDPRLIDSNSIVDRFWTRMCLPRMWAICPTPPPADIAFYNFHFQLLLKMSRETQEMLKLKIYFTLCMKIIQTNHDYVHGREEDVSSIFLSLMEKPKKLSRFRFSHLHSTYSRGVSKTFSNYFLKTFIDDLYFRTPRKAAFLMDNLNRTRKSLLAGDSFNLHPFTRQTKMNLLIRKSSGTCFPFCIRHDSSSGLMENASNQVGDLIALLDCFEISDVAERLIFEGNDEDFIQEFNFFEKLEPRRMVQRLLEAQESYNTTQCSCFPPTDALVVLMYNDFDHRGIFYTKDYGVLLTPVFLKDFYHYVYPEIGHWLIEEEEEYTKTLIKIQQKEKEVQDMKDKKYLSKLKRQFCQMSEEQRQAFLVSGETGPQPETEIAEKDLKNLPKKPKLSHCNSKSAASFIATNFTNLRVEVYAHVQEYYSMDGTQVIVRMDSWLYGSSKLLALEVKQPQLTLLFHKWLRTPESNSNFSLKTDSGIIFNFFKNGQESQQHIESEVKTDFNYFVNISWPTGLLIQGVPYESSGIYIKQNYIKVYRKGWDIKEEKNRCYLKNGQVVIFKETGDVEILCANGEIYYLYESEKKEATDGGIEKLAHSLLLPWVSKCEWTTTTGEVWEKMKKDCGKIKKTLLKTNKIYVAVDCKAQEIYYKREDGVACMLRSNGKLVTTFPDGTKITSTPEFDEEEIVTQWSEEEKIFFSKKEFKSREDQANRSRAILRKPDSHMSDIANKSSTLFQTDAFVSVSCSYLMEHPKYSSVCFTRNNSSAVIKMPGKLSIKMDPQGNYEVVQEKKGLNVQDSQVEFYRKCGNCREKSTGILTPDSKNIIYKLTDFNDKVFSVYRNGGTDLTDSAFAEELNGFAQNTSINTCFEHKIFKPLKKRAENQRCFALERDLSGYEFFHKDTFALQNYNLPEETHYDLNVQTLDDAIITHTFSSSYYKIGFENWKMKYEDKGDSLPTNLKKKDLREIGVKEVWNKFNKCALSEGPLPTENPPKSPSSKKKIKMPKVVMTRIVKCFPTSPATITADLKKLINAYQKRAQDISRKYTKPKSSEGSQPELIHKEKKKKLKWLKSAQNLKLNRYAHLGIQIPSTDIEIHKAAHFLNLMETLKSHFPRNEFSFDCKQLPRILPRISNFTSIKEENEDSSDSVDCAPL